MTFSENANRVFDGAVASYHVTDCIDAPATKPYAEGSFEAILHAKCWVDAAQWHMEDLIRVPDLDPAEGMALKRRIDRSNQVRTDMVEDRDDAGHRATARGKLAVLLEQRQDLGGAIDTLLEDIAAGRKYMKVYRQMKLYNDPATNPELYRKR